MANRDTIPDGSNKVLSVMAQYSQSTAIEMIVHRTMKPSGQIKSHKCDTCGGQFEINGSLIAHNIIHRVVKPFKCNLCGLCFARK